MISQEYLDQMKKIQKYILDLIDNDANIEENFLNLINFLEDLKITDDKYLLQSLLHLISNIENNHNRHYDLISKLERILLYFQEIIQKYFSNSGIFNIFKRNKRILLFLTEKQMMIIDKLIAKKILTEDEFITDNYPQYFGPEVEIFENEKWFPNRNRPFKQKQFPFWLVPSIIQNNLDLYEDFILQFKKFDNNSNFYELRRARENDSPLCQLIQKDLIKEFIVYVNKNNTPLNSKIEPSIYETNSFLNSKQFLL